MNRRGGIFGPVILLVLLVLVVWIWAVIIPGAVGPSITIGIEGTQGDPYADGIEFFLRALPWAVPVILIIGFLWLGATK